jgi:DNA-binding transcriptional ArsR family regulator
MKKVRVNISYGDLEYSVEGEVEDVIRSVITWLEKVVPAFDVASKLVIDIDYVKLSDVISRFLMISKDGDIIFKDLGSKKLSLSNKVLLSLSAAKLLHVWGKRNVDGFYLYELSKNIGASSKTISSRLSELYASGYVEKSRVEDGVLYYITIKGILKVLSF